MPLHPPDSHRPRMGISRAPNQISTNCRTSLKIADSSPPSTTYTATVIEETQMLKWMSQPRMTFITRAIEYMFTPLIRMVMNAKEIADSPAAPGPKRRFKYPGTEWVLEM